MVSSAKCGSHGLSASLDSNYANPCRLRPSGRTDSGRSILVVTRAKYMNEGPYATGIRPFLFSGQSLPAIGPITREHHPYFLPEYFLYESFLLRLSLPEEYPPAALEPALPLPLRPGVTPRVF